MSRIILTTLLVTALALNTATADDAIDWNKPGWELTQEERAQRLEVLAAMSEDDQAALREQHQSQREAMSDEEKAAMREAGRSARQQKKAEWEAMTPEQRKARKQQMQDFYASLPEDQKQLVDERMAKQRQKKHKKGEGHRKGQGKGHQMHGDDAGTAAATQ